jgi:Ca2+-binding RTX toxin-like protein
VVKGDLKIKDANNYAINLVAGYASNLILDETVGGKDLTVNLKGTTAGASITANLFDKSKVNLVVKADSVLSNADKAANTLKLNQIDSNFVITGDKNLTIDGKIDIVVAGGTNRLDATDFTGKLTLNLGKDSKVEQIVGGKNDDTFTLTAIDDQIDGVALNGNDGNDTLTVKVGFLTPAAINGVTNVETIIFKEALTDTTITTKDTLVASGATLTVDASSFTTKILTFDGAAESDGSFKITGGALADVLTGGDKNDTLTGNGGPDILTGGVGNDQFLLNKATDGNKVTIADFTVKSGDNDVFALSNAAFTGAPAVGATLTVSAVAGATNSANTILVDNTGNLAGANLSNVRFGYATDTNKLYYDADGAGFTGASSILIANAPGFGGTLTAANFAIVA